MLRSFLLVPCLLIGLACATPFPLDSLEEGMTMETVREEFGAPEAIETEPGGVEVSWSYVHEEQIVKNTVMASTILVPHCIIFTPFMLIGEGHPCFSYTVERKPVVLHFAEGKLARWEVLPDPLPGFWDQGGYYQAPFPSTMTFPGIDAAHHAKGHKHHHPGC
jgi:hypothetical protein